MELLLLEIETERKLSVTEKENGEILLTVPFTIDCRKTQNETNKMELENENSNFKNFFTFGIVIYAF